MFRKRNAPRQRCTENFRQDALNRYLWSGLPVEMGGMREMGLHLIMGG